MSASFYYFFTGNLPDIATRVANLDDKITIDLNLSMVGNYVGTSYNPATQNVEVLFLSPLSEANTIILTNLAKIALYDAVVDSGVYVLDTHFFNRYSTEVTSVPTINHDINSGYAVASIVTTTSNGVYICTKNTPGAAVWVQLGLIA